MHSPALGSSGVALLAGISDRFVRLATEFQIKRHQVEYAIICTRRRGMEQANYTVEARFLEPTEYMNTREYFLGVATEYFHHHVSKRLKKDEAARFIDLATRYEWLQVDRTRLGYKKLPHSFAVDCMHVAAEVRDLIRAWRRGELLELHGFGIWHPYFGGHPKVHLIKDRMLGRTMHGQREGYRFDFFEVNPLKVLEKINAKTV